MIDHKKYLSFLKDSGVQFISGVPDTLLNDLCLAIESDWPKDKHVLAANEGNAIALATGYHLANGSVPMVYMQNSGMGNALNPIISLTDSAVYSIPLVLLIGWRGEPGSGDWPQHQRQGELSPKLLDLLNIPFKVLEPDETQVMQATEWAFKAALDNSSPTALLVKKGVLALKEKAGFLDVKQPYTVTREESINAILEAAPQNSCFVASTGRITRELFALRERHNESHDLDFLNVGAMGHALSIASGIASAQPSRPVICLDGDGAAIMHLGSLPITANLKQKNLLHVVLNNGVHESVGGQSTVGHKVSLTSVARDVGYNTIPAYVEDLGGLVGAVRSLISSNRCSFVEMRIKKGMSEEMPILKMSPTDSKQRFMSAIKC